MGVFFHTLRRLTRQPIEASIENQLVRFHLQQTFRLRLIAGINYTGQSFVMAGESALSQRLSDQNVWNATLSNMTWGEQTEAALREWGVDEFFEGVAAVFPYEERGPLTVPNNSAFTTEERRELQSLVSVLNHAWDISEGLSGEEFLKTHWASQMQKAMDDATAVMRKRGGYFSTIREEPEPSIAHPTECPSTVFVPLLEEALEVWRPADAESLGDGSYRLIGPVPDYERWAFPAGSLVKCEWKTFADGEGGMTAIDNAD